MSDADAMLSIESGSAAVALPAVAPTAAVAVADFAGQFALAQRNESLAQPPAAETALAREKTDAVQLWKQLRRDGLTRQAAADQVAIAYAPRFPRLARGGKHGAPMLTVGSSGLTNLSRWDAHLGDGDNPAALVRDYARGRRERKGDPRFWALLGSIYLARQGPHLPESYRAALRACRSQGIADLPTYRQAAYWYEHCVDQAAIVVARDGEEALAARFQYFIRRDWDAVTVNDIWFGDHHDLDAPARWTDPESGEVKAVRCTLTAWMDARSLYFTGWQIAPGSGNNDRIQTALALGIITAGMIAPTYLYVDNGADYRAKGFDKPVDAGGHLHAVLLQLGIDTINSLPYRAQAKVIERVFGIVCENFSRHWAGYRGNRPENRTEKADYYWDHPEYLPTVEELSAEFGRWLAEVYHCQPSAGCILQGQCPQEMWNSRRDMRAPWSQADLYTAFLMPVGTRTVGRGPSVALDSEYYYSEKLWPFCLAKGDQGKVLVKIDRYDREHVFCFHLDGRPICEACTRDRVNALALTPEERAKIGEAERIKKHQRDRAYTVVAQETGGTYRLADPRDRIRMLAEGIPADAIEKVGSRSSVKGGSHQFKHYALPPAAADAPPDEVVSPVIEFRQPRENKDAALLERLLSGDLDPISTPSSPSSPSSHSHRPPTAADFQLLTELSNQGGFRP